MFATGSTTTLPASGWSAETACGICGVNRIGPLKGTSDTFAPASAGLDAIIVAAAASARNFPLIIYPQ
jgi:hypothetical protein